MKAGEVGAGDPTWQEEVLAEAVGDAHYAFLVVGACLIATLGLLANSTAVIIGAMLVAPLMLPIRALALAWCLGDRPRIEQALIALIFGLLISVAASAGLGALVDLPELGSEAMARTQPNLLDLGVALVAGSISAQAKIHHRLADSLAGTAIAVALMPPLCTLGLALGMGDGAAALGAALLFITNWLGILLACMGTFLWAGLPKAKGRGRGALLWTSLGVILLTLPLGWSFRLMWLRTQVESKAKETLTHTSTFQGGLELIHMDIQWHKSPPLAVVSARGLRPPSPNQIQLIEQHIRRSIHQDLMLQILFTPQILIQPPPSIPREGADDGP